MIQLRESLDLDPGGRERTLLLAFDGGYTNATVLKKIPARTVCALAVFAKTPNSALP